MMFMNRPRPEGYEPQKCFTDDGKFDWHAFFSEPVVFSGIITMVVGIGLGVLFNNFLNLGKFVDMCLTLMVLAISYSGAQQIVVYFTEQYEAHFGKNTKI